MPQHAFYLCSRAPREPPLPSPPLPSPSMMTRLPSPPSALLPPSTPLPPPCLPSHPFPVDMESATAATNAITLSRQPLACHEFIPAAGWEPLPLGNQYPLFDHVHLASLHCAPQNKTNENTCISSSTAARPLIPRHTGPTVHSGPTAYPTPHSQPNQSLYISGPTCYTAPRSITDTPHPAPQAPHIQRRDPSIPMLDVFCMYSQSILDVFSIDSGCILMYSECIMDVFCVYSKCILMYSRCTLDVS